MPNRATPKGPQSLMMRRRAERSFLRSVDGAGDGKPLMVLFVFIMALSGWNCRLRSENSRGGSPRPSGRPRGGDHPVAPARPVQLGAQNLVLASHSVRYPSSRAERRRRPRHPEARSDATPPCIVMQVNESGSAHLDMLGLLLEAPLGQWRLPACVLAHPLPYQLRVCAGLDHTSVREAIDHVTCPKR